MAYDVVGAQSRQAAVHLSYDPSMMYPQPPISTPPPPCASPLAFPPVVYMSEDGPLYLQSAGWGEVPHGNPIPLVAYLVKPQPQLGGLKVPLPPQPSNAPEAGSVAGTPPTTSAGPSAIEQYGIRFRWRGGAEIVGSNGENFAVKEKANSVLIRDHTGTKVGEIVTLRGYSEPHFEILHRGEVVGRAEQLQRQLKPRPARLQLMGWKIMCDPYRWEYEIKDADGNPLLTAEKVDGSYHEKFTLRSFQPEYTSLAILLFAWLRIRLRKVGQ